MITTDPMRRQAHQTNINAVVRSAMTSGRKKTIPTMRLSIWWGHDCRLDPPIREQDQQLLAYWERDGEVKYRPGTGDGRSVDGVIDFWLAPQTVAPGAFARSSTGRQACGITARPSARTILAQA